jgi:hypothetical protein
LVCEIAQAAADAVVVAIAGKIAEQKDGIVFDERDIGESLLGLARAVKWRAAEFGEAGGDAPSVERDD